MRFQNINRDQSFTTAFFDGPIEEILVWFGALYLFRWEAVSGNFLSKRTGLSVLKENEASQGLSNFNPNFFANLWLNLSQNASPTLRLHSFSDIRYVTIIECNYDLFDWGSTPFPFGKLCKLTGHRFYRMSYFESEHGDVSCILNIIGPSWMSREVGVLREAPRQWEFFQRGKPVDIETPCYYERCRVRDRLNREILLEYMEKIRPGLSNITWRRDFDISYEFSRRRGRESLEQFRNNMEVYAKMGGMGRNW